MSALTSCCTRNTAPTSGGSPPFTSIVRRVELSLPPHHRQSTFRQRRLVGQRISIRRFGYLPDGFLIEGSVHPELQPWLERWSRAAAESFQPPAAQKSRFAA